MKAAGVTSTAGTYSDLIQASGAARDLGRAFGVLAR